MADRPLPELLPQMNEMLERRPGLKIYLKWTCPNCGERVTATEPNMYYVEGYVHESCGHHYQGEMFGVLIEKVLEPP